MSGSDTSLGEKVRSLRKELKMTQRELAGDDFTKSFISQVEKGLAKPSLNSMKIIASRLNKPVSFFLEEDGERELTKGVRGWISAAQQLLRDNQDVAAAAYLEDALNKVDRGDFQSRGTILAELAKCYAKQGNLVRAETFYQKAVTELEAANDLDHLASSLNALAAICKKRANYDEAISYLQQALDAVRFSEHDEETLELRILTNLGILMAETAQYSSARSFLQHAVALGEKTQNYYKYGEICHTLSYIHGKTENLPQSLAFARRAVCFYEAVENVPLCARAYHNLGTIKLSLGREDAAEDLQKALHLGKQGNDFTAVSNASEALALLALDKGNAEESIERLQYALKVDKDGQRRSHLMASLAKVYEKTNVLEKALSCLKEAERELVRLNHTDSLAEIYAQLAEISQKSGDAAASKEYLQKSVECFRQKRFF